jgi:hypothetical protein
MNPTRPIPMRSASVAATTPGTQRESVSVLPERMAVHGPVAAQQPGLAHERESGLKPAPVPTPTSTSTSAPAPAPAPANTSLHIERLVIQGVSLPAGSTARLEAAFQAEWRDLASATPRSNEHLSSIALHALRLEPIRIDHAGEPEQLGRKLARALWGGLAP